VLLKDISKTKLDKLFEHNKTVSVIQGDDLKEFEMAPREYTEEDTSHFKSKSDTFSG